MRTTVAIIGAGPSGLLLSHLLNNLNIDNQVLEHRSRNHVENRVRAGQLDHSSVSFLESAGLGGRMRLEGIPQKGVNFRFSGVTHHVDLVEHTDGCHCTIYGQSELTKDLIAALVDRGFSPVFEAANIKIPEPNNDVSTISYEVDGVAQTLTASYIIGCDGAHGPCREALLKHSKGAKRELPFAWIGLLSETPPISNELTYVYHSRGFALWSMRTLSVSRTYLQCAASDQLEDWTEDRFWSEMVSRLGEAADDIQPGRTLEAVKVPMHGFVAGRIKCGNMILAGDAAHIVPPSAAKGLNLAISDVSMLSTALAAKLDGSDPDALNKYEAAAQRRAWAVQNFSWQMTDLLHAPSGPNPFDHRIKLTRLEGLLNSSDRLRPFCKQYVGAETIS